MHTSRVQKPNPGTANVFSDSAQQGRVGCRSVSAAAGTNKEHPENRPRVGNMEVDIECSYPEIALAYYYTG
jgi:hypothetical protein